MHDSVHLSDLELHEGMNGIDLRAVGYELRPQKMRPNVWVYEAGETSTKHRHETQEELYHVLSGRFEMVFLDADGTETETVELESGGVVVVSPDEFRQLRCVEAGEVFVVGAPNTKDEGIVID
ncbi:cupin domain-containing protein (plasmid) [Haloferax sp. S1W]|uniref:cupin domain-containing protein n=1 Tax=Haloferax sp. S1W TaxID=3377110 RepID=UPI0037C89117